MATSGWRVGLMTWSTSRGTCWAPPRSSRPSWSTPRWLKRRWCPTPTKLRESAPTASSPSRRLVHAYIFSTNFKDFRVIGWETWNMIFSSMCIPTHQTSYRLTLIFPLSDLTHSCNHCQLMKEYWCSFCWGFFFSLLGWELLNRSGKRAENKR